MKAILTVGIPASGKTTKYKDFKGVNVNRDSIRDFLFGFPYKFTRDKERQVTDIAMKMIDMAAKSGKNLVISDTNLNKDKRDKLTTHLEGLGYHVELDIISCSYELAVKRDLLRERSVGSDVIWKMFKTFNEEFDIKPVTQDKTLTPCYIFDIDGTLADMVDRNPYDWSRVSNDSVNDHVLNLVKLLTSTNAEIIILSGRDSCCIEETVTWLKEAGLTSFHLHMRPIGDTRKDFEVKYDLYCTHIEGKYYVQGVFDDRPQVCRLWNLLNLPLFKVGDQSEF